MITTYSPLSTAREICASFPEFITTDVDGEPLVTLALISPVFREDGAGEVILPIRQASRTNLKPLLVAEMPVNDWHPSGKNPYAIGTDHIDWSDHIDIQAETGINIFSITNGIEYVGPAHAVFGQASLGYSDIPRFRIRTSPDSPEPSHLLIKQDWRSLEASNGLSAHRAEQNRTSGHFSNRGFEQAICTWTGALLYRHCGHRTSARGVDFWILPLKH